MKFIKKNLAESLFRIILMAFLIAMPTFSFVSVAVAATISGEPCDTSGKICNPLAKNGIDSVPAFIKILLEGVIKVGIPIVALAVIYCGFLFVSARGKPEALTKAKDALLYTLIGAAILLGSFAIANLISDTVLSLK